MNTRSITDSLREAGNSLMGKKGKGDIDNSLSELADFIASQRVEVPERVELPEVPEFQKVDVQERRSDEQLREQAESKLANERHLAEQGIDRDREERENKLTAQRENTEAALSREQESLNEQFDRAKEAVNNDALRRGIARSSIAFNREAQLEDRRAEENNRVFENFNNKINEIENTISGLDAERERALADFNIAHAARIAQSIHSLRGEQEKAIRDAIAFNNTVLEQQRRAEIERENMQSTIHNRDVNTARGIEELTGGTAAREGAIFQRMVETLDAMPAAEARRQLRHNPIFRENLTTQGFYRLYDMFFRTRRK